MRLIAGNLIPGVVSLYRWEGRVERDEEVAMLIETTGERVQQAASRLCDLHPYEVPKIIVIDPASVDDDYLTWLREVTSG